MILKDGAKEKKPKKESRIHSTEWQAHIICFDAIREDITKTNYPNKRQLKEHRRGGSYVKRELLRKKGR